MYNINNLQWFNLVCMHGQINPALRPPSQLQIEEIFQNGFWTLIPTSLGTSESRRLLQDAMKYGHLQAYISKMLFYGSAGVGKTCTKEIIAGDAPPDTRQSTPLATRPVTLYQVDAYDLKYKNSS